MRDENVMVTGATGFIGRHVSERLLREGAKVRALARREDKARALAEKGVEICYGDITDGNCLREAIRGCRAVFHFAGLLGDEYRPWEDFLRVNVEGTRLLIEAALAENVERFVYASTAWVYGLDAGENTDERAPLRFSKDRYCDTKTKAELLVREYVVKRNLPCVIVQPTSAYGPGDETWTLKPIKMIKSRTMIYPGFGKGLVQPIFIDDLVEGIMAAYEKGRTGEAYLLCGGEVVQIREFFGYFAKMLKRRWLPKVPGWLGIVSSIFLEKIAGLTGRQPLFTKGAVRATLMSATYRCNKAQKELGFSPKVPLVEGMEEVRNWIAELGL